MQKAYEEGGIEALKEKSKRKANIRNRVPEAVEQAVVEMAFEEFSYGQKRVKALEDHVVKTGAVLTESQLKAMEKAKEEKIAWGQIEIGSMWATLPLRTPSMWPS